MLKRQRVTKAAGYKEWCNFIGVIDTACKSAGENDLGHFVGSTKWCLFTIL
jgi:hypothetical protein